jgi:hypothetical protein
VLNKSAETSRIRLKQDVPPNSYEAVLVPAANDELIFEREVVYFHNPEKYEPALE